MLLVAAATVPLLPVRIPGAFNGALSSPGALQVLALCLVFGAVAVTYDLLYGFTGLLSFGHALSFATGLYVPAVALSRWHWSLAPALALTAGVSVLLPLVLGAVSLRVTGIAFAMVTLAFAQAGSILVLKNPGGLTGGEEGLGLAAQRLPDALVGVVNTRNLYWLALGYLAFTYGVARWGVDSRPGRVWQAIRENERRVEVLGLRPYAFKLLVFVLASFLAAAGGVVYLLLAGGATPQATTASFSLAVLVMVVLGGAGRLWGAVLGGILYQYLDYRLVSLANSAGVHALPPWLRAPLSEPLFILGTLFVLIVLFFPGGIAGIARAGRGHRRRAA